MSSHHHSNPIFYIFSGAIAGISAFVQEHGFIVENIFELMKVISFGLIGGACGYIGKAIAMRIHQYLKDKSKDVCN